MAIYSGLLKDFDRHQRRLITIIAGLVVLGLVLLLASYLLGRSSIGDSLERIAAVEQEIIRIDDLADKYHPDLSVEQVKANVTALSATDMFDLNNQRQKQGDSLAISQSIIDEYTNQEAEDTLSAAAGGGSIAPAYKQLVSEKLNQLKQLTEEALSKTKRQELRGLLGSIISHADELLKQLDSL